MYKSNLSSLSLYELYAYKHENSKTFAFAVRRDNLYKLLPPHLVSLDYDKTWKVHKIMASTQPSIISMW